MPLDPPCDAASMGRARLHHELKNPLAVILGRAQVLQGALAKHPGLSTSELARLLASLQNIEYQVQVLVARIDTVQSVTYAEESAE